MMKDKILLNRLYIRVYLIPTTLIFLKCVIMILGMLGTELEHIYNSIKIENDL